MMPSLEAPKVVNKTTVGTTNDDTNLPKGHLGFQCITCIGTLLSEFLALRAEKLANSRMDSQHEGLVI